MPNTKNEHTRDPSPHSQKQRAHLALVEPDGVDHTLDGAVKVGVVKDDDRRLSAQLQGDLLAAAGCQSPQQLANLYTARRTYVCVDGELFQCVPSKETEEDQIGEQAQKKTVKKCEKR